MNFIMKNTPCGVMKSYWLRKNLIIMRCILFFLLLGTLQTFASVTYSQSVRLTLEMENATIQEILSAIEQRSSFYFTYNLKQVNVNRKVSVNVKNETVKDILDELFSEEGVKFTINGEHIVLYQSDADNVQGVQQVKKVTGVIKDDIGDPVIGANVMVKGKSTGCITDINGTFLLDAQSDAILQISFIGYVSQEIKLNGRTQLNVILKEDSQALDEVVIVGYGSVKKQNLTSSVSKISTDAIQERPISTLGDAFQGQLAGVRAQNTSGIPGEDLQIRIRGVNTINGNSNPLYVIDGVPREDMNDLNPGDVASIQVLKDASATSIYGARGANGVILIETKQGTGKPTVSFDVYYGLQDPEKSIQLMDSKQWLAYHIWRRNLNYLRRGGSMKDPMSMRAESERIPDSWLTTTTNTDWQDAITETAPIQSYQVSASAKGDIGNIFFSAGYLDQQGIITNTYYKRLNFRLNAMMHINKHIRVGISVAPSASTADDRESQGKETVIHHALTQSPIIGLDEATRDWGFPSGLGKAYPNPLERLKNTLDNTKKNQVATSVWGDVKIIEGLVFKTQFSYNYAGQTYEFFQPGNITYNNGNVTLGNSDAKNWKDWSIQNTLTYDKTFKSHAFNIMVGQSADEYAGHTIEAVASGWPAESITTLNVATTPTKASTSRSYYRSVSVFGRASYNYKEKYLLTASLRYDGSSRFGDNKKYGIFPSVSGGWKINEEGFMKDIEWISLLKLRAAWGMAGNDRIGNYDYMALLGAYNTSWGNSIQAGVAPSNIENKDLKWEATATTDLGFDFSGFNNRLQFNFDYYINRTNDLLFNVPIPYTTGFSSLRTNLGKIENRGWEIDVTSHNLIGEFKWSTSLNLSRNKNKVLDMGDITEFTNTSWDAQFITRVGGPVSQFYCYRTDGILMPSDYEADGSTAKVAIFNGQEIGNVKYIDQNKDGQINSADLVPYGNNLPDLIYGLTNRFSYKNFDLSFLLQGQLGGDVLFLGSRQMDNGVINNNSFVRWLRQYKPDYEALYGPGENPIPDMGVDMSWDGKTPSVVGKRGDNNDDTRIYDSSYLRIKNVTFAYTLPKHLLEKTILNAARFYISIDNLKTFDSYPGITPETNSYGNGTTMQGVDYGTYPLSRKYTLGLNVTF